MGGVRIITGIRFLCEVEVHWAWSEPRIGVAYGFSAWRLGVAAEERLHAYGSRCGVLSGRDIWIWDGTLVW